MGAALLMALALSLDGFGVGLAYGLRRISIPVTSMLVIAMCTVIAMGTSMLFGTCVTLWFSFIPAHLLGALIIFSLGFYQLARVIRNRREEFPPQAVPVLAAVVTSYVPEPIFRIQLRLLGLVIQVLRTPDMADIDGSGVISVRESLLLGCALALDAFAGGIGAAMAGMKISVIGVVAVTQIIVLWLGQKMVCRIPENWVSRAEYLPGLVLILIGLGKMI